MNTKYIKVAVSERKPNKSGSYYSDNDKVYYRQSTGRFEHDNDAHCVYPDWWLEEIPDNEESLLKQNEELKSMLRCMKIFFDTTPHLRDDQKPMVLNNLPELLNKLK